MKNTRTARCQGAPVQMDEEPAAKFGALGDTRAAFKSTRVPPQSGSGLSHIRTSQETLRST
jgi:hypothetical protein